MGAIAAKERYTNPRKMDSLNALDLAKKEELKTTQSSDELELGVLTTISGLLPLGYRAQKIQDLVAPQKIKGILVPAGRQGEHWPPLFGPSPPFELGYLYDHSQKKYFLIPERSVAAFREWLARHSDITDKIETDVILEEIRNSELPPAPPPAMGEEKTGDSGGTDAPDKLVTISLPASIFQALPPGQKIRFCQVAVAEKLLQDGYEVPDEGLESLDVVPF